MIEVARWGTTMSPSDGLFRRLSTMLLSLQSNVTITPAVGISGTVTPALAAISAAHGPAALITRSAPIVSLSPVWRFVTFTPATHLP